MSADLTEAEHFALWTDELDNACRLAWLAFVLVFGARSAPK